MRVADVFGHEVPSSTPASHADLITSDRIGIEIELEGVHPRHRPTLSGWDVIGDGSLRDNGVEFVFDRPSGGRPAINRIRRFEEWVEGMERKPVCSERTSVHVHVDVREMQWNEMWDMVLLYSIVEPFLFEVCGQHRSDNIYSLSLLKGEGQSEFVTELRDAGNARHMISSDEHKYASVNFGALRQFGSLEFRGHEGTYDADRIIYWVNCLLSLKKYVLANEFEVDELPKIMSTLGPAEFLRDVFGDLVPEQLPTNLPRMMYRSALLSEDILHHYSLRIASREVQSNWGGDLVTSLYPQEDVTTNIPEIDGVTGYYAPTRPRRHISVDAFGVTETTFPATSTREWGPDDDLQEALWFPDYSMSPIVSSLDRVHGGIPIPAAQAYLSRYCSQDELTSPVFYTSRGVLLKVA